LGQWQRWRLPGVGQHGLYGELMRGD
jgi:hypothetical protein